MGNRSNGEKKQWGKGERQGDKMVGGKGLEPLTLSV
jgi:hypothetical protein